VPAGLLVNAFPQLQSACRRPPFPARVLQTKCSTASDAIGEPDKSRCTLVATVGIPVREPSARSVQFHPRRVDR
jgi:hypothetical protein